MSEENLEVKGDVSEESPLHMETKDSKEPEDLRYGWRNVRPRILQVLNSPKCFVFALATFAFVQGMCVSGFTNLYLLTLERRFQLTSTEVGFVAASNDIAGIVLTALVSFYGTYGNKPKWLGYGCAITGFGCLMFVLPQALVGRYEPLLNSNGLGNGELCRLSVNGTSEEFCLAEYGGRWYYIFIFFLAQLLMGGGTTPLYTLGPAYIDENVHPKSSPIYLAVFFACSTLGPGLGFISGGSLLNIYVDVNQPEGSNLTPDDPQWIGAWWIGFLIGGFILVLITGLLLGFPRELPGAKRIREEAAKEGHIPKKDERLQGNIKDILPATLQLLKAPVFMFNTLGITSSSLFGAGIASFLPKILQLKYGLNPFITGAVIGTILVPGTVGGVVLGGFIVRKFDLKRSLKMAARFCVIAQVFTILGSGAWFIPGCGTPDLAGLLVPYSGSSLGDNGMSAPCNANCSCSLASINPVCGEDNLAYFSPCHAGCKVSQVEKSFANCTCVHPQGNATEGSAVKGFCEKRSGCKTYIAFILLLIIVLFSVFITAIANKTVVLRCVPYNQRAYALGFQFILQRSLGFLPGPILFGAIFDGSCLLWGRSCGKKGNCQFFDMTRLTDRLGYTGFSFTGVSLIFYFLSYWFCKPTIQEEEEKHRHQQLSLKEEAENENNANGMFESSI